MAKRRVTIELDADLLERLGDLGPGGLDAVADEALRDFLEGKAHHRALLAWLEELDEKHGRATPEEQAEVEAFLEEAGFPAPRRAGAP